MDSAVTAEAVNAFYKQHFSRGGAPETVLKVARDYALLQFQIDESHLRPGGYVSGPTQMGLADSAAYVAVFTRLGIVPMAVTSNLTINFMRPCIGSTVLAEAKVLKLGRTLAVIEVDVRAEGAAKAASHAVINYALPPSDPAENTSI